MPVLVPHPFQNVAVGIDASVPEVRPDSTDGFGALAIQGYRQDALVSLVGTGQKFALGAADETVTPETNAVTVAGRIRLDTPAIRSNPRTVVAYRVAALNGYPGFQLSGLFVRIVGQVPANGSRVDQYFRTGQCHQPGRFRVPLVPAHQHPQFANGSLDGGKPAAAIIEGGIAGGKVEFLIEARVVRDMHFAV